MSFDRVVPILVLLPLLLFANPKVIGGERLNQLQESDYDVFSVDFPGKWAGKAGTHAPMIKIVGSNLEISVNHAAKNIDHMVTHLILLNENRKIVALELRSLSLEFASFVHSFTRTHRKSLLFLDSTEIQLPS